MIERFPVNIKFQPVLSQRAFIGGMLFNFLIPLFVLIFLLGFSIAIFFNYISDTFSMESL